MHLPRLRFSPHDLQTSVGNARLQIVIDELWSLGISDQDLASLASKASLETYPGGVRLAFEVQVVRAGKTGDETFIVLQPTAPLTHQWYAMRLSSPPAGVVDLKSANFLGMHEDANGDVISRFHPGAQPVVEYMHFAGPPVDGIGVKFSENVDFTARADSLFRFEQGGKTLSFFTSGPQASAGFQDIVFAAPLSVTQPLTIEFKPGIVSSAPPNTPLSAPGGKPLAPITVVLDQLPKIESSSVSYHWVPPL